MDTNKILYIVTELHPFLQFSSLASITDKLIKSVANKKNSVFNKKNEIRVIMPKFGCINERRNSIHEIQRLCGVNIPIEEENISLIVKVGSIKKIRVQVYFIDNEDLFQNQTVFHDKDGRFNPENDTRIAFMCKAALAMLDCLAWSPDIVHCFGWPWALLPMYGKVQYKHLFPPNKTKFLYTYGPTDFKEKLGLRMLQKASMSKIKEEHLAPLGQADFQGFLNLAATYADKVTYSFDETNPPALENKKKTNATHIPNDEKLIEKYQTIYQEFLTNTDSQ